MPIIDIGSLEEIELEFFHTVKTSGQDDAPKNKFRKAYLDRMELLGVEPRCAQCNCLTHAPTTNRSNGCNHATCQPNYRTTTTVSYEVKDNKVIYNSEEKTKVENGKCSTDAEAVCVHVGAHVHIKGCDDVYLINTCSPCNTATVKGDGTITLVTVKRTAPIYVWPLNRKFIDYLRQ